MPRPVSLTAHRNTRDKREMHRVSRSLVADARYLAAAKGVAGYVVVAWNPAGRVSVAAQTSGRLSPIPVTMAPEFVRQEIARRLLHPIDADPPESGGAA